MTDVTAGASIHFTTDGSTPTASSPLYSAPFTVNTSGTTIQAIATAPSYSASAGRHCQLQISNAHRNRHRLRKTNPPQPHHSHPHRKIRKAEA
jgi:hypothetical protein